MNAIPPRHDGPLAARDRVSRGHDVLSRLFAKAFHKVLDRIDTGLEHGALEAWLPDGTTRILGGRQPGTVCEVHLHSWRALVRLGLSGSAGWFRAWAQGEWESPDPVPLFALFIRNASTLGGVERSRGFARWEMGIAPCGQRWGRYV